MPSASALQTLTKLGPQKRQAHRAGNRHAWAQRTEHQSSYRQVHAQGTVRQVLTPRPGGDDERCRAATNAATARFQGWPVLEVVNRAELQNGSQCERIACPGDLTSVLSGRGRPEGGISEAGELTNDTAG